MANATWLSSPGSNDFDTGSNWSTGSVPGQNDTASFGTSNTEALTFSQTATSVGTLSFASGTAYSFTLNHQLALYGSGLVDGGGNSAPTFTLSASLTSKNSSSAVNATITCAPGASITFNNPSTAGNATIGGTGYTVTINEAGTMNLTDVVSG